MNKVELRQQIKKELANVSQHTYLEWSNQISAQLFEQSWWKEAHTIGITISRGREVNTEPIIQKAWDEGKKIVVPKCNPSTRAMDFRQISTYDDLETVYFGLREPKINRTFSVAPDDIDLLIVPGLLFDNEGYRIGFGGGYYDRFLMDFDQLSVSLAFPLQLKKKLPTEAFDQPVDCVVTNEGVIGIKR